MPSYTETFPCPVCCGTTTSTTSPPSVCPEGYEPCEGENLWNWVIQPPDCYWEELISCSEGCDSYQPSFTPLCEAGQEIAASGLCCKPIGTTTSTTQSPTTSTTENPSTSTTCAPGQTIGFKLQNIFNEFSSVCKICVAVQCGSSEPNIFYTCEECESQANVFNSAQPFCNLYECSPAPPL
jgi:hypothetical protein